MATEILPPEIIADILRRLPSKSLGRFKCVSKDWLTLISQPQFIKTHQKTLSRNHLIFLSNDDCLLYSLPFNEKEVVYRPTKLPLRSPIFDTLICHGSSNGLVLVTVQSMDGADSFVIMNPTTREFLELPKLVHYPCGFGFLHGFGYDFLTDDYKVFTVSYEKCILSMRVYSVRTKMSNSVFGSHCLPYGRCLRGVFVNGFLHWIAKKVKVNSLGFSPVIFAFSVADHELSEVPSPIWIVGADILCKNECTLVAVGDKLAVSLDEGEVWLMNDCGVRESWTKIVAHKHNHNPVFEQMIRYDSDKLLLARGDRIWRYDVEKSRFCASIYFDHMNGLCICSESLVSPKSLWE